ncbi:rhomboid family protein [Proteiniborus sp. DW1]|nr:rhomboid family protein [Proteiniborus sp. DW1]
MDENNMNYNEGNYYQVRKVVTLNVKRPIITYILIIVNVAMWALLNYISLRTGRSYSQLLFDFGAKININIINGQYWRFITPIFLHADFTHLLVNCYSLYAVGPTVERIYGKGKFLFIYVTAGFMGSLLSFMFSINPSVGASGAIFGLLGTLLYFGVEFPNLFKIYFGRSILITLAINLAYGFMNTGIDNFGHMGGLLGGFLASGIVKVKDNNRKWYLSKTIFILLTIVIGASGLVYGFNYGNNNVLVKLEELYKYDSNQNWKEAASLGEEILNQKPTNKNIKIEVLWITTKAEAITGNYNKAVEYAKTLAKLSPKDGHYMLGIVYYDMGQFEQAKQELQRAKTLNAPYSNIDDLINSIR